MLMVTIVDSGRLYNQADMGALISYLAMTGSPLPEGINKISSCKPAFCLFIHLVVVNKHDNKKPAILFIFLLVIMVIFFK